MRLTWGAFQFFFFFFFSLSLFLVTVLRFYCNLFRFGRWSTGPTQGSRHTGRYEEEKCGEFGCCEWGKEEKYSWSTVDKKNKLIIGDEWQDDQFVANDQPRDQSRRADKLRGANVQSLSLSVDTTNHSPKANAMALPNPMGDQTDWWRHRSGDKNEAVRFDSLGTRHEQ